MHFIGGKLQDNMLNLFRDQYKLGATVRAQ